MGKGTQNLIRALGGGNPYHKPAGPGGGQFTSGSTGNGGSDAGWDKRTNDPSRYHPLIKEVYEAIPPEIRKKVPPPTVVMTEDADSSFALGNIYANVSGAKERVFTNFVHEFGHYVDTKHGLSDSPAFKSAFAESQARVKGISKPEYPMGQHIYKRLNYETMGKAVGALTQGKDGWLGHPTEYFSRIKNADRKEVFALALSSHVLYSPNFFKTFPELKTYFETLK